MIARARLLALLALLAGCAGSGPSPGSGDEATARCTHLESTRQARGQNLCEDVWTCGRPPGGRFDRIGLHRLALCDGATGPLVLYLPGAHMSADIPFTDPRFDLRLYLAQAGVVTWGLSYRTHVVPPAATAAELSALSAWDADVFADDAAWAAAFVRAAEHGPVYLAGFSYGGTLAYRLAGRRGESFAGLVILDAALGSPAPPGGGPALDVASERLPWPAREQLLRQVLVDPDGPAPIPGYPSAGTALVDIVYTSRSFGGAGGLSAARERVTDVGVLARLLASEDRWWPRAALTGGSPSPPGTPIPVLAFASTNAGKEWTERVTATALAWGRGGAQTRSLPGWGHLDVLVARNAARQVFEPVRSWLLQPR